MQIKLLTKTVINNFQRTFLVVKYLLAYFSFKFRSPTKVQSLWACSTTGSIRTASLLIESPSKYVYVLLLVSNSWNKSKIYLLKWLRWVYVTEHQVCYCCYLHEYHKLWIIIITWRNIKSFVNGISSLKALEHILANDILSGVECFAGIKNIRNIFCSFIIFWNIEATTLYTDNKLNEPIM